MKTDWLLENFEIFNIFVGHFPLQFVFPNLQNHIKLKKKNTF
jgi:hypothetical protein